MLLRNGSSWFRFASGDNVPGDIPSDAIAQQFATHRRKLVDLFFIALKIAGELIRIFLHKLNRNVLDVCLSDIAQVYHPSDIGFPNIVILFKCNAVLNQGNGRRYMQVVSNTKWKTLKAYTPSAKYSLSYERLISSWMTFASLLMPSRMTSSSE